MNWLEQIQTTTTQKWTLMEVCGGQTHAILKHGLDQLISDHVEFLHGPGCPVCVTSLSTVDAAIELALQPHVILCTFGDMLRVPGTREDLLHAKAQGADIRLIYSPTESLEIAKSHPTKEVVLFAVGFETTAPTHAMTAHLAREQQIKNFSMLTSLVCVPPAIEALLNDPNHKIDAFIAAGHVCTIMGYEEYKPLCEKYEVPIVITGFEAEEILEGVSMCLQQLEAGQHRLQNQYSKVVSPLGNPTAQNLMKKVYRTTNMEWRGLGIIPQSGWELASEFEEWDARKKFHFTVTPNSTSSHCLSGEILQGTKKPFDCPYFAKECTPDKPRGATMVSHEGACSAYYFYKNNREALK